jgi:hypothetical protein
MTTGSEQGGTGRSLEQLQNDAELNARHILTYNEGWEHLAGKDIEAVRQIVAEAWAGGRAEIRAEHTVPEGSADNALDWLKACIQGYDYLLADPQPGLHTWAEARARARLRILEACRVLLQRAARPGTPGRR